MRSFWFGRIAIQDTRPAAIPERAKAIPHDAEARRGFIAEAHERRSRFARVAENASVLNRRGVRNQRRQRGQKTECVETVHFAGASK
jgi:hypothetical protein